MALSSQAVATLQRVFNVASELHTEVHLAMQNYSTLSEEWQAMHEVNNLFSYICEAAYDYGNLGGQRENERPATLAD